VPPGDASALAAAISGAAGQLDRFPQMGSASRTIVEEEFSWSAAGAAVLRLYDELLD
jgi:glycosyltransferase involved in cell wall biosynthesis